MRSHRRRGGTWSAIDHVSGEQRTGALMVDKSRDETGPGSSRGQAERRQEKERKE
jgi:hypothetical protein